MKYAQNPRFTFYSKLIKDKLLIIFVEDEQNPDKAFLRYFQ